MSKTMKAFRLDPADYERLVTLGRWGSGTATDALRQCVPSRLLIALFGYAKPLGHTRGKGFREWIDELLAEALRQRMIGDANHPIDPHFLPPGKSADFVFAYYLDWLVAQDLQGPEHDRKAAASFYRQVIGCDPDVYLAKPPAGGEWERRGVTGWAVLQKGERFTPDGIERLPDPVPIVTVRDMLDDLRSDDAATRILAGLRLAYSLGVGLRLAGEHQEDVEHLIGPQLSDLLGRAMAGDPAAVHELERVITTTPPVGVAEPSAEARELAKRSPGELLDTIESEEDGVRRRTLVEAFFVSLSRHIGKRTPAVDPLFALGDGLAAGKPEILAKARELLGQIKARTEA